MLFPTQACHDQIWQTERFLCLWNRAGEQTRVVQKDITNTWQCFMVTIPAMEFQPKTKIEYHAMSCC